MKSVFKRVISLLLRICISSSLIFQEKKVNADSQTIPGKTYTLSEDSIYYSSSYDNWEESNSSNTFDTFLWMVHWKNFLLKELSRYVCSVI